MTNETALAHPAEYEEAFKAISTLRADGRISGYMYEILWNALETKRANDETYKQGIKNLLQKKA